MSHYLFITVLYMFRTSMCPSSGENCCIYVTLVFVTITTCFLRESNPNYQCLKITSCRGRPPPRMHSFTATTHFKSSRSFVPPCVCCMLCRMRLCRILQSMQHTQSDTKERELLKFVVAVKECIRGGGRNLQDVIFKH